MTKRKTTTLSMAQKIKVLNWLQSLNQDRIESEKLRRKRLAELATSVCGTEVTVRHIDGLIQAAELKIEPHRSIGMDSRRSLLKRIAGLEDTLNQHASQIMELRGYINDLLEALPAPAGV